jgi:hypothetical protein
VSIVISYPLLYLHFSKKQCAVELTPFFKKCQVLRHFLQPENLILSLAKNRWNTDYLVVCQLLCTTVVLMYQSPVTPVLVHSGNLSTTCLLLGDSRPVDSVLIVQIVGVAFFE